MLISKYQNFCKNNNYDYSKLPSKRFHYLFSQNIIAFLNIKPEFEDSILKTRRSDSYLYVFNIEKLKKYFNVSDEVFLDDDDDKK